MDARRRGPAEASRYLIELLSYRRDYAARWRRRELQSSTGSPSQAAVARVVAEYLVDTGERCDGEKLHRQLKDRIARVFTHLMISRETLAWVTNAFSMTEPDTERLFALFDGSKSAGYIAGLWPPAAANLRDQGLDTLSLHELHTLGPDGLPRSHRTVQVVRATADNVHGYLYRFDTNTVNVEVVRGGNASLIRELGGGIYAMEIAFTAPLIKGDTWSLEYVTQFNYRDAPPPEFRRGVIRRIQNLEVRVQFDAARLPAAIWWGSWTGLDSPMAMREQVFLDGENSVHRYLDGVEAALVGFGWAWERSGVP